jgi:hypothetical protein
MYHATGARGKSKEGNNFPPRCQIMQPCSPKIVESQIIDTLSFRLKNISSLIIEKHLVLDSIAVVTPNSSYN